MEIEKFLFLDLQSICFYSAVSIKACSLKSKQIPENVLSG